VLRKDVDGFRPEIDAGFVKPVLEEMADIVIHVAVTDFVPDLFDHLLDGFELIFGTRTGIPVVLPGGFHRDAPFGRSAPDGGLAAGAVCRWMDALAARR
jgi:hypothetical protein